MSNTQEQSLNENVIFQPVTESSPEFLHCEKERQAVERLLSSGSEAFYSSIDTDRSGCFLSPEEVSQITSWAQDYHLNGPQLQKETNGGERSFEMEGFCSTYFPCHSDTPPPDLDLGWPERSPWGLKGSLTVHTSPPAEGDPPVREIIRRHLQKASQVIAIVTDRLTDGAIIGDLHSAASRGVSIYIILNQRSIQENAAVNRLRHPNMRVRVLGGKTFCSRIGEKVVGEMKDKFLLVDLETVIHGSYSLTWTDAHLHRQLITVLSGPVIESFDKEFRILFAASHPIPDTWRVTGTHVEVTHQQKDYSNLRFQKHLPRLTEPEITLPPSPPVNTLLDWEAMGVVQTDHYLPDGPLDQRDEMPLQNYMTFEKSTPMMDGFTNNRNQFAETKRVSEWTSPLTNNVAERSTLFNKLLPTDPTAQERLKRVDRIIDEAFAKHIFGDQSTNSHDRKITRFDDKATEPVHNMATYSSTKRGEFSKRGSILEEESSVNESSSKLLNTPSSRKPLILRVPQPENFSSLSDILKRFQPKQSTSGLLKKGSKAAVSEMSRSMMDLSVHNSDLNENPVPRFKARCFDPGYLTPAVALLKKRNDEVKPLFHRAPKNFLQRERERPRSSSYTLDWRRSQTDLE